MTLEQAYEYIRKHTDATDFTLSAGEHDILETRFAQNAITQHMSGLRNNFTLEVAYDNKVGEARVNRLDEENVEWLLETAQHIARLNQPDPEYVPSPGPTELPAPDVYDEETAAFANEKMVDGIIACVKNAESLDAKVSGLSSRITHLHTVFTANGFAASERQAGFRHSMTLKKGDAETKVARGVKRIGDFDMRTLIAQLNDQFASLKDIQPSHAGKQTVILRPMAVMNLFSMLNWYMNRRSADEGASPYTDQIEQRMFGEKFSLLSTREDPELDAPSFDQNLQAAHSVDWVRDGVLKNLPVERYWAQKQGIEPLALYNMYIPGGAATESKMMKQAGSGLIINNFWYIRMVDQKRGEMTGMTRDGVMRFENGEIVGAAHNLRWNEIPHEVTRRILALGPAVLLDTWVKCPTLLVEDFNFVDTTTF